MSTSFPIFEAEREGAKTVTAFAGTSGSGKTYTAILFGYGLAGCDASQLGFLDTENKRGRLYADILPGGKRFRIADFQPPFSPDRYIEGIQAFEKAGVRVLVIDSLSHEWEGIGGCEEIATEGVVWPKPARWNVAKLHHKKFMNALLQSSMDIVVCVRAREKVDMKNPKEPKSLGLQPITEKNVMYEMTASLMMHNAGRTQEVIKCPEALLPILGRQSDYITAKDGQAFREWIDGAKQVDREIEQARAALATAAESGVDALGKAWSSLSKKAQHNLAGEKDAFKESAAAYDRQKEIAKPDLWDAEPEREGVAS